MCHMVFVAFTESFVVNIYLFCLPDAELDFNLKDSDLTFGAIN